MSKTLTIDHQGGIFVSWLVINDKPVRGAAGCLEHVERWAARCGVFVTYTEREKQKKHEKEI